MKRKGSIILTMILATSLVGASTTYATTSDESTSSTRWQNDYANNSTKWSVIYLSHH